nr:MAG TPA: hypothetical protein [Caudoviricetes sp.]
MAFGAPKLSAIIKCTIFLIFHLFNTKYFENKNIHFLVNFSRNYL